ncbi:hypothetical protein DRP77_08880 [Candidatus Poribacteria bacterium]|nr:MAG: hypothetical protein DRP77_08880 [Candidatus Poribacteria bacterium]
MRGSIERWLAKNLLLPGETLRQIQTFILERIPPLTPPKTAEEWRRRAGELRERLLREVVLRGVPGEWVEGEVKAEEAGRIDSGKGYVIRKLRYEALPGMWIPALLYEPVDLNDKAPAVLNVNGHVGPLGKAIDYEQLRCINLAKRGMIALHPEWIGFGELGGEDYAHNKLAYLDLCGVSGLSVFYLAVKKALDLLLKHPKVDPKRIAMTGLSGGGWQTILLSALDERVSAVIPNAGYIGMACRAKHPEDIGDLEQNPADMIAIADYTHLTAMLAPRPTLLIYNAEDDCCFRADRARRSVYEPVRPFFELFGAGDSLSFYENKDPGTHNYDRDNREQLYRFLNRFFSEGKGIDEEIPSEDELLSFEELRVGLPEENETFKSLAVKLMEGLPELQPPEEEKEMKKWRKEARERLREVVRLREIEFEGEKVGEEREGDLEAAWFRLRSREWTVPAVAISRGKSKTVALVFGDSGRAGLSELVEEALKEEGRVVAFDLLFTGECVPDEGDVWKYVQMMGAVGERALGVQAAQIGAVIEWASDELKAKKVSIYAAGRRTTVAALIAGSLFPKRVDRVLIRESLSSLKRLVEWGMKYEDYPELFCFGLLKLFDIRDLMALCAG